MHSLRKLIISTIIMFLRVTFPLNFLHGPLPCLSSCHLSLGESCSCIKNPIIQHSYPRLILSSS
uniref:Uncharacterized protein n=1 Tax=Arundo donax TaxID=35708 RepID=A0A0A9DRI7_ARUDO